MASCCCCCGYCTTSLTTVNANSSVCKSCKTSPACGLTGVLTGLASFGSQITGAISRYQQAPVLAKAQLTAAQTQLQGAQNSSMLVLVGIAAVVLVLVLRK